MQTTEPVLNANLPRPLPFQGGRPPVLTTGYRTSYLSRYVTIHSICFFLYAVLGKGFAYAGHAPLFVGEILLFYGLYVAIRTRKPLGLAHTPIGFMLLVFALWEIACTLPFFGTYGFDALRDAMLWGYSLFAWVVASVVLRYESCLGLTLNRYRQYGGIMLILMFTAFLTSLFFGESLPKWPGTLVHIVAVKPGDMCVHVAGLIAFVLVGLGARRTWWMVPAFCAYAAGSVLNRGGMIACGVAVAVAGMFYADFRRVVPWLLGLLLSLALGSSSNLSFQMPGAARVFSANQLVDNLESAFGSGVNEGLEGTKQWRLIWWTTIVNYTLHGPYFWTGKGFGINLTISDGVATNDREFNGLRSPHNSHLTFLARSGVPGASLWIILQATWAFSMLRAYRLARRGGKSGWARLFVWLFAYWLAFMINATFDVSLEGPVCGIPFWTIFGLGWGAYHRFKAESPGSFPGAMSQSGRFRVLAGAFQ